MDPITIVTAAASLAGAVLTASLKIKNTIDRLENAPQNVSDIADEIYAVQYALSQVEDIVRRDPNVIDRLALQDVFALAVKGCHATLQCIHKEYEELFAKSDWKTKILVLWKDGEMTRLLGRLDRKKATLTLLTQTLNLRSTQDIKDLLVQNQATLMAARQDSLTIGPLRNKAKNAHTNRSITLVEEEDQEEDHMDNIHGGDNESVLSTTEFDFDYDLINTRTYRRALARAQAASRASKPTSANVDKALPELNEEKEKEDYYSPACLRTVSEDVVGGDVSDPDLINLSTCKETTALQVALSRATTLLKRPDNNSESSTLWSSSPSSVSLPTRIDVTKTEPPFSTVPSLVSGQAKAERESKQSMRKRMRDRHAVALSRLEFAAGGEKPHHRKRPHGKVGLSKRKQHSENTPSSSPQLPAASTQSLSSDDAKDQEAECFSEKSLETHAGSKVDKQRQRHRCGRKADLRHRARGNHADTNEGGVGGPTITTTTIICPGRPREVHMNGFSDAVNKVEGAVRRLNLSEQVALKRERIRRRQIA